MIAGVVNCHLASGWGKSTRCPHWSTVVLPSALQRQGASIPMTLVCISLQLLLTISVTFVAWNLSPYNPSQTQRHETLSWCLLRQCRRRWWGEISQRPLITVVAVNSATTASMTLVEVTRDSKTSPAFTSPSGRPVPTFSSNQSCSSKIFVRFQCLSWSDMEGHQDDCWKTTFLWNNITLTWRNYTPWLRINNRISWLSGTSTNRNNRKPYSPNSADGFGATTLKMTSLNFSNRSLKLRGTGKKSDWFEPRCFFDANGK